jgi:hypothetical protein
MPDNVSLTAQEINTLKSVQTNAQTRLNIKNFCFNSNASNKLNARTFPIIGNNSSGMRIYAGYQDVTLPQGSDKAIEKVFDMSTLSFISQPVVTATFSSDSINQQYLNITTTIKTNSSKINEVTVYIKPDRTLTSPLDGSINLIAIGYA